MLIYNGDTDSVCDFLGDAWFIERIAAVQGLTVSGAVQRVEAVQVLVDRRPWLFRYSNDFKPQTAGYVKRYSANVDLLTVKVEQLSKKIVLIFRDLVTLCPPIARLRFLHSSLTRLARLDVPVSGPANDQQLYPERHLL
jgi:hypothetical protein